MNVKKFLVLFVAVFLVLVSASAYAIAVYDCNNGARYEDMGDGTVQDCLTGLIWLKDTNCLDTSNGIVKSGGSAGALTWYNAMVWTKGLGNTLCSLSDGSSAGDWRLPTKTEWMAMVASAKRQNFNNPVLTDESGRLQWTEGHPFNNVLSDYYRSSTVYGLSPGYDAWCVDMADGTPCSSNGGTYYVWPVRGGQSGEFGSVIIH